MDTKKKKSGSSKKELKTSLTSLLHGVLVSFKETIHEKKLEKLVKKAAKVLADGLHHNKPAKPSVIKKAAAKKEAPKKAAVKKAAPKKAAKKK